MPWDLIASDAVQDLLTTNNMCKGGATYAQTTTQMSNVAILMCACDRHVMHGHILTSSSCFAFASLSICLT